MFHNDLITMTLIREKKIITYAKQDKNLFVFELTIVRAAMAIKSLKPRKTMAIISHRWLIYLVNQNKHIRVWHQKLANASNA